MSAGATYLTEANLRTVERICESEPVLVDVCPALEVVPGMTKETILASGAPLPWNEYTGGQRDGIIGAALFEGLAKSREEVEAKLAAGDIQVRSCHAHGCVGSMAGIYSASMPVFVVENRRFGNRGYCNFYEGESRYRLNYGCYNEEVRQALLFIQDVLAPVVGEAVRTSGGVPLWPIMRRALHMGDELHSRNAAAAVLFTRELFPRLLEVRDRLPASAIEQTLEFLYHGEYFFLRLTMASSKATADAAHGIEGSSVVSAMTFSCRDFAIRVSGLGDEWFRAPIPMVQGKFFEGFGEKDVEYMGGESIINETVGLGGFAQAAAFPLQEYQGGSPEKMIEMNLAMYEITLAEHPEFRIPYFRYRGTPVGIEIHRVVETGITPVMDIGISGKGGGQIGAGTLRAPLACFEAAVKEFDARVPAGFTGG